MSARDGSIGSEYRKEEMNILEGERQRRVMKSKSWQDMFLSLKFKKKMKE